MIEDQVFVERWLVGLFLEVRPSWGVLQKVDRAACNDWCLTKMKNLTSTVWAKPLYCKLLPEKMLAYAGDLCTGGEHSNV